MNATMLPLMTIPLAGQTKDMYAIESAASVLDVGGRRGGMMAPFVEVGHRVTVIDLSSDPAFRPEIRKVIGSFLEWKEQAQLIVMSHVLEHTNDPCGF